MENTKGYIFETIINDLFVLLGYTVATVGYGKKSKFGLIVKRSDHNFLVDIKFYRTKKVSTSILKSAANALAFVTKKKPGYFCVLVVNTLIEHQLKIEILHEFGVNIWDLDILYNSLTDKSIELRDKLEKLLLEDQQGVDISSVFPEELRHSDLKFENLLNPGIIPKFKTVPEKIGDTLSKELNIIQCGQIGWAEYEQKCFDILKLLFENDLRLWEKQNRTEDGLSRFDLICRIASSDDYWKAIVSSFNTRFILF